jgi:hypothetical protein
MLGAYEETSNTKPEPSEQKLAGVSKGKTSSYSQWQQEVSQFFDGDAEPKLGRASNES